jgi:hypothetical protein
MHKTLQFRCGGAEYKWSQTNTNISDTEKKTSQANKEYRHRHRQRQRQRSEAVEVTQNKWGLHRNPTQRRTDADKETPVHFGIRQDKDEDRG